MDENLVGYLLDALDPGARDEVERTLESQPELRERLERLRMALAPLAADAMPPEPPSGLVCATLARIAEHHCRPLPAAPLPTPYQRVARGRRVPRWADLLVAASLLIVLGGLALSAVTRIWRGYQFRDGCANNLRAVWAGLQRYADFHDGAFPRVETDGPRSVAAAFAPILLESGALAPEVDLVCPAERPRPQAAPMTLAQLEQLYHESPTAFAMAARDLAGSYAYSIGYREGDSVRGLSRGEDDGLPILADHLSGTIAGNSFNHGGGGQNVLYVGGNVRWCTTRTVGLNGDDIYLNRHAQVSAGVCRDDTVLGSGSASPRPQD